MLLRALHTCQEPALSWPERWCYVRRVVSQLYERQDYDHADAEHVALLHTVPAAGPYEKQATTADLRKAVRNLNAYWLSQAQRECSRGSLSVTPAAPAAPKKVRESTVAYEKLTERPSHHHCVLCWRLDCSGYKSPKWQCFNPVHPNQKCKDCGKCHCWFPEQSDSRRTECGKDSPKCPTGYKGFTQARKEGA